MTIPNFITLARFLAVPVSIYAIHHGEMMFAFIVFLAAGISDGIDGLIARRFNQHTALGAWLDPVADKLLLVSVFIMLGYAGHLPDWLVLMAVARDVLIVGAVLLSSLMGKPLAIAPLFVSKVNTAAQIGLVCLVLMSLAFAIPMPETIFAMTVATAGLTAVSAASYLVVWMRHMSGAATPER